MIRAGYWRPRKDAEICVHPMRERRARFGELIQIDGSPHYWFEGCGERCTLLAFIDDATGRLTQLRFVPTETTLVYMHVLHDHILLYGAPAALYSDKHSIVSSCRKNAFKEPFLPTREPVFAGIDNRQGIGIEGSKNHGT